MVQSAQQEAHGEESGGHIRSKYSDADHTAIAKYACQHGAAAAARYFSRNLGNKVSISTVKSIKKVYIEELRKRPRTDDGAEIDILPAKKCGWKVILGSDVDRKIQAYLRKVRDGGGAVNSRGWPLLQHEGYSKSRIGHC